MNWPPSFRKPSGLGRLDGCSWNGGDRRSRSRLPGVATRWLLLRHDSPPPLPYYYYYYYYFGCGPHKNKLKISEHVRLVWPGGWHALDSVELTSNRKRRRRRRSRLFYLYFFFLRVFLSSGSKSSRNLGVFFLSNKHTHYYYYYLLEPTGLKCFAWFDVHDRIDACWLVIVTESWLNEIDFFLYSFSIW